MCKIPKRFAKRYGNQFIDVPYSRTASQKNQWDPMTNDIRILKRTFKLACSLTRVRAAATIRSSPDVLNRRQRGVQYLTDLKFRRTAKTMILHRRFRRGQL